MKQILWFRRDLRISDSEILTNAKDEVLPIFIFDKDILGKLDIDDKRVTFIYQSVLKLKEDLKSIGLDLAIFYSTPVEVFRSLQKEGFDEVLSSIDYEQYSIRRDNQIEQIVTMRRFLDSFILKPNTHTKKDKTPYKVFTPFYKALNYIWESESLDEFETPKNLKKIEFNYDVIPSLEEMGFEKQELPEFLTKSADELIDDFSQKISEYQESRDFFYKDGTSNMGVHLRFGLISPRQVFNKIKTLRAPQGQKDFYIRELFWREFYNYILFHFPKSETQNFNGIEVKWRNDKEEFKAWCEGNTGVPIIDASMRHFNATGTMHNRLRMIVASYLTKNLLIDWKWGEKYFASKLLDYEASSNIGSWQWGASTGADSVPYFRVFNPYLQSAKFDKEAKFIKSVIPELEHIEPKLIHTEGGVQSNLFVDYPQTLVSISFSRDRVISEFKRANIESKR